MSHDIKQSRLDQVPQKTTPIWERLKVQPQFEASPWGNYLVLPFFILKGIQIGSLGEEGNSLDTVVGHPFQQGRSSRTWGEILQGQGGQGGRVQTILLETSIVLDRCKQLRYGPNPSTLSHLLSIRSPNLSPIFFPIHPVLYLNYQAI